MLLSAMGLHWGCLVLSSSAADFVGMGGERACIWGDLPTVSHMLDAHPGCGYVSWTEKHAHMPCLVPDMEGCAPLA
jgi:hypothetical protein